MVIKGQSSAWTSVKSGVPQGSILGPLLFLIYTNDIVKNIESDILLFADDTCLLETIRDKNLSIDKINRDLERLSNWASQWLVQFNPTKTKYLVFSKKQQRVQYGPLFLQNKVIQETDTHKHLGLTLTNSLTWDAHINRVCTEAGRRLGTIKRLPTQITPHSKLHIYCTFVRPILEYGSVIFDGCITRLSDQLESIQRQAALAATRAYKNTSSLNLLSECGLPTLQSRRTKAKLILFYKIQMNICPSYMKTLLPPAVHVNTKINIRNANNINMPKSKSNANYFLKSYIPSTIKTWNSLAANIKNIAELDTFKLNLKRIYCRVECYKPYLTGQSTGHILLARIRMNLSGLNAHRKRCNFINFATCPNCGNNKEDEEHFLFLCTAYAAQRLELMAGVGRLLPHHTNSLNHLE